MLSDKEARWKNFSRGNPLELPFESGAKTGTSQLFRDNWVIGFSPLYTVGVWVGNPDASSMFGISGIQGSGPLWHKIMLFLHKDNTSSPFSYEGNRRPYYLCRREDPASCSEKVTAFLLPSEQYALAANTPPSASPLTILYPGEGDTFLEGSGLLIQVQGDPPSNIFLMIIPLKVP